MKHSSHRSTDHPAACCSVCCPCRSGLKRVRKPPPALLQSSFARLQKTAGRVGVQVVAIPSGRVLFAHRAQETFVPASVVKLFTSYGALKQLGPQHRFTTTLWVREKPQGSVIPGDLWLKSEGDPFLLAEQASSLARQLRDSGRTACPGWDLCGQQLLSSRKPNRSVSTGTVRMPTIQCCPPPPWISTPSSFSFGRRRKREVRSRSSGFLVGITCSLNNLATTSSRNPQTPLKVQSLGMTQDGRERYQITGKLPLGSGSSQEYRVNIQDPGAFVARSLRAVLQAERH